MSLTIEKLIRASFMLDGLCVSEDVGSRVIVATQDDLEQLHESADRSNAVLFNDSLALVTGRLTEVLGFRFLHPAANIPAQLDQSMELEGFNYYWRVK